MRSPVYPYTEMITISVEGIIIEQDPISGGHWLDRGELAKLAGREAGVEQAVEVVDTTDDITRESSRLCPKDNTPLLEVEFAGYQGLKVDVCPTCGGLWLDAHELSQALTLLGRPAPEQRPSGAPGTVESPETLTLPVLNLLARLFKGRNFSASGA